MISENKAGVLAAFQARLAKRIEQSRALMVARRMLFTSTRTDDGASTFDLNFFYQYGTGVLLISRGTVYVLTASHVVRNATENKYSNDSPFWVSRSHEHFNELMDFLMPWRYFDCSPDGQDELDVGLIEINSFIPKGVVDALNWDDDTLFVQQGEDIDNLTAVVMGYPEDVNPWYFPETNDAPIQVAQIRRATFRGTVTTSRSELWFENLSHRDGYKYAGLSGGIVVCFHEKQTKYLGIVVSRDEGKRFRIIPFFKIREKLSDLALLAWEVLDEAYFLGHPTHRSMNYSEQKHYLKSDEKWTQPRSSAFSEQLLRSLRQRRPSSWICDLEGLHAELKSRLKFELIQVLGLVKARKLQPRGLPLLPISGCQAEVQSDRERQGEV